MSSPSLQLDVEKALKTFIASQNIFTPAIDIHAARETDLALDGTYLALVSSPPDWYQLGGQNAVLPVVFKFATQVNDPATRAASNIAHAARTGALIDLLCEQRFGAVRAALNLQAISAFLQFDVWCEEKSEESHTDTQVVTSLDYEFIVHLTF
jgi:hypothetical protein